MRVLNDKQRSNLYALQKKHRDKIAALKAEYLKSHPCVDCGEADIIVLDFDHVNPEEKSFNLSRSGHRSWELTLKEINKCEVRCSNCHRRRTYKQRL